MTLLQGRTHPDWLDVSAETAGLLEKFVGMVEKWNPAINLVSRRSVPELWERHVLDSAQLFDFVPKQAHHLVDLGSGGGFPGLVLGILAHAAIPAMTVTLVEVDQRKATFLSEAVRNLGLTCSVLVQRIESVAPQRADVVTARALAPLVTLCGHVHRHMHPEGVALIAKGLRVEDELSEARKVWSFTATSVPSKTDENATILVIRDLRHV